MIKHEFPIYIWPRTCRWPASTWFPFLQQSLTQRYKIHSMFNLKMKWSCKRLTGCTYKHPALYIHVCTLPPKDPKGPSLSQFRFPLKSHWTVSVASRAKKSSELIPFDHSFLSPPREPWFPDAVFSLLVMQISINSFSVNFIGCSNILVSIEAVVSKFPVDLSLNSLLDIPGCRVS